MQSGEVNSIKFPPAASSVVENSAVSGAPVCSAECHPFSRMKCGATVTLNFRGTFYNTGRYRNEEAVQDVSREASNPTTKFCKY